MQIPRSVRSGDVSINMTPMIDVVFQLIAFFMFSFKVAAAEGDFNIKMPLAAPSAGVPNPEALLPPIRVRLVADANGELAGIRMGERALPNFNALHNEVIGIVGTQTGPGSIASEAEVELDVDYNLHYKNVISAITAVSGYVDPNGRVVKLIEKIKFAPPRKPGA
jgi:biopolymer transport protein ExbD